MGNGMDERGFDEGNVERGEHSLGSGSHESFQSLHVQYLADLDRTQRISLHYQSSESLDQVLIRQQQLGLYLTNQFNNNIRKSWNRASRHGILLQGHWEQKLLPYHNIS